LRSQLNGLHRRGCSVNLTIIEFACDFDLEAVNWKGFSGTGFV
jgi:hypothetical protein